MKCIRLKIVFFFMLNIAIFINSLNINKEKFLNNKEENQSYYENKKASHAEENNSTKQLIKQASDYIKTIDSLLLNRNLEFTNSLSIIVTNESNSTDDLKLKFSNEINSDAIVEANIVKNLEKEGWNRLNIETHSLTNSKDSKGLILNPYIQMYLAGYIEGKLTNENISTFYNNIKNNSSGRSVRQKAWEDLRTFLNKSGNNLFKNIENSNTLVEGLNQEYSDLLSLGVFQLKGILEGYNDSNNNTLTVGDFLIVQADGEISELSRMLNYRKAPSNFRLGSKNYFKNAFNIDFKDKSKEEFFNNNFHAKLNLRNDHCSALVKVLRDSNGKLKELLTGHVTWSDYSESIKYIKRYKFGFKTPSEIIEKYNQSNRTESKNETITTNKNSSSEVISTISSSNNYSTKKSDICTNNSYKNVLEKPAEIIFTAYPGTLSSTDDFYLTSEKLMVTETTLEVIDVNLYKKAKSSEFYIPNFLRVNSATIYSRSSYNWMHQFCTYNTGTYSSQWIINDYKVFENLKNLDKSKSRKIQVDKDLLNLSNGMTIIMEQTPDAIIVHDLSKEILENSYFPGFNKAFFQETQKDLNTNLIEEVYGEEFSYEKSPRKIIFNLLENKITSEKEFKDTLMYNGYNLSKENDNNKLSSDPSYSNAAVGISSRYDLTESKMPFGGTDFKMTSLKMISNMEAIYHSGPTTENNDNLIIFNWDDYDKLVDQNKANKIYHEGVPNSFNFPFIKINSSNILSESDSTQYKFD